MLWGKPFLDLHCPNLRVKRLQEWCRSFSILSQEQPNLSGELERPWLGTRAVKIKAGTWHLISKSWSLGAWPLHVLPKGVAVLISEAQEEGPQQQ